MVNNEFLVSRQSVWLKIGFSASNPPTDPPFSCSGAETRRQLSLASSQSILRPDRTSWVGGSGPGFVWAPLWQVMHAISATGSMLGDYQKNKKINSSKI